ncbi:MAG: carboxypeptidase-like regulatory domain-containing protein [Mariniblastus sp.]
MTDSSKHSSGPETGESSPKKRTSPQHFQFGLRSLILLITLSAIAIYFFPKPKTAGNPNLIGQVTDSNGVGISGVKVKLYGGVATRFLQPETITDANGDYGFRPMKCGALSLPETGEEFAEVMVGIQLEHSDYLCADGATNV